MGKGRKVKGGHISGLEKEGGGLAAREGLERLEDGLRHRGWQRGQEAPICTGEGTLQPLPTRGLEVGSLGL